MTTLKDIWPVMILFYDYNMLFIEKIYVTETFAIFFFVTVQSSNTKL